MQNQEAKRKETKFRFICMINNFYLQDGKPNQELYSFLEYVGLTLDQFKLLSTKELLIILNKIRNPMDVGRETKSIGGSQIDRQLKTGYASHFRKGGSRGEINSSENGFGDSGDLSRYFSLDAWTKKNQPNLYKLSQKALELQHDTEIIYPFLNTSKPSQTEANAGLDGYILKNNISEDIIKEIKKYVDK